jgi:hypothetical protein
MGEGFGSDDKFIDEVKRWLRVQKYNWNEEADARFSLAQGSGS